MKRRTLEELEHIKVVLGDNEYRLEYRKRNYDMTARNVYFVRDKVNYRQLQITKPVFELLKKYRANVDVFDVNKYR